MVPSSPTWLGHWKMSLVIPYIGLVAKAMSGSPPVPCVVFIGPVEGTDVEYECLATSHVHGGVSIPAIAVNKAWLQDAPVCLEGQQKTGNDLLKRQLKHNIQLGPFENG